MDKMVAFMFLWMFTITGIVLIVCGFKLRRANQIIHRLKERLRQK